MATCKECATCFALQSQAEADLCPDCAGLLEERDIDKVTRYLEGHPHDTLVSIVAATGVPFMRVKKLIVGGRLERRSRARK